MRTRLMGADAESLQLAARLQREEDEAAEVHAGRDPATTALAAAAQQVEELPCIRIRHGTGTGAPTRYAPGPDPDVWEEVFRPLGIGALEVLHAKTEMPLKTVVQLDIPREDVELHLPTYEFQQCDLCTTKKYLPISRGFFPSFTGKSNSALFRSREFFGSGGSAFNEVFVTQSLCKAMRARKLRGVRFKPVALGESL